jgi:minor extracellular serine protease Vpr
MLSVRNSIYACVIILIMASVTLSQVQNNFVYGKLSPTLQKIVKEKETNPHILAKSRSAQAVAVDNDGNEIYGVIIKSSEMNTVKALNININSEFKDFVTARITVDDIIKVAQLNSVSFIETGEVLYPTNDVAGAAIGADLLHNGYFNSTTYKGNGVIICIIDTGIDWTHPDFRSVSDQTKSRIQYIWDQTLTKTGSEKTPEDRDAVNLAGLNYGVEYSKADIEDELDGSPASFVRENDTNGHGTHVAGSAAGNGAALSTLKYAGIAPEADIVVVKAGNGSFPTTNSINALTYAKKIAEQLGKPIVVNMSLGGQSNAHDGTASLDQAVDNFVGAGRVAVISAGNDGANNIHITGSIAASATANITFTVPSYTANSGASNDYFGFDLWFNDGSDVSATVSSPTIPSAATQAAEGAETIETASGFINLYNYINSNNNDREIYTYIYDGDETKTPTTGTWTLAITNNSSSDVTYHGWLYGSSMGATLNGGNSQYTVASPGTASTALTVGSFVTRWNWYSSSGDSRSYSGTNYSDDISSFSSIGPRRDGVQKPDIAAPGQAIISALSSSSSPSSSKVVVTNKYLVEQGTSMASPITAGAVALLLQQSSGFTYSQVKSFITNNANTDSYTGSVPNYEFGYGKLNIFKSMVKAVNSGITVQQETPAYDGWTTTSGVYLTTSQKVAVKFTPSFSGKVTGLLFHLILGSTITSPVYAEIWSDNAGLPGSLIGSTASLAYDAVTGNTWNFINMQGAGVNVNSGTNYHAVIYWTSTSGSNTAIEYDNTTVATRSSLYSGSWGSYSKAFRIRPIITTSESALPVELSDFSANVNNNKVNLNWETATETNNYGFDIERASADKKEWSKIGFIKGNGNSNSPKNYSFIDEMPNGGNKLLYRLKQIDLDGNFEYSPEVDVELSFARYLLAQNFPNPFNPATTISFEIPVKDKVKISLFDILGRKVSEIANEMFDVGIHKISFDGSRLASGIYFLKMEATNFHDSKKITLLK